jgi:hypothetical protein
VPAVLGYDAACVIFQKPVDHHSVKASEGSEVGRDTLAQFSKRETPIESCNCICKGNVDTAGSVLFGLRLKFDNQGTVMSMNRSVKSSPYRAESYAGPIPPLSVEVLRSDARLQT